MEAETVLHPGAALTRRRQGTRAALRRPLLAGAAAALLALALGIWPALPQQSVAPAREVSLVAQDGRFDRALIEVRAGERVRLTIANRESSAVSHDFAIAALGVKSPVVEPGQVVTITFTAKQPGSYVFGCTIHPRLMDGKLIVTR